MWNDTDYTNGGEGGGFNVSGYDSSPSSAPADNRQSRKPNSLFPVAIKQIVESTEDPLTIHGYPVSMMTIVGIIRHVELTSTKVVYTIQDWSGTITGMLWLEGQDNAQKISNVVENTYCRMTGTKRMQDGKACLFVYDVSPIADMNELNFHYLQIIHIGLKADEMRQDTVVQSSITAPDNNSTMTNIGGSDNLGLTPHQRSVYSVIQACTSEAGIDKKDIIERLKSRVPITEIERALQFLTNEGHLYNSVDDDHFKVTDN